MELQLLRDQRSAGGTLGRLSINGVFQCFTLEDPMRAEKIVHETAIPCGRYEVVITESARFKKPLPLLLDVPGFTGIRIHAGNTTADTSGCILVGQRRTTVSLLNSRLALLPLQKQIADELAKGHKVFISIETT